MVGTIGIGSRPYISEWVKSDEFESMQIKLFFLSQTFIRLALLLLIVGMKYTLLEEFLLLNQVLTQRGPDFLKDR